MAISKKHNHLLLILIAFFFGASLTQSTPSSFSGKTQLQAPFSDKSPLKHISSSAEEDQSKGYELGTRASYDVPDHVPNICEECEKPNGNCGVGLRCICHPKDCKNKVVSMSRSMNPVGNGLLFSLCFSISLVVLLQQLS